MSVEDTGSANVEATESGSEVWTWLVFCVGGCVYWIACMPAIQQRGYPPIDPFWEAIPFLWFIPLVISAAFDDRPIRKRAWPIIAYAFATGFVDSGTLVNAVPHRANAVGMLLMTIFFYGPIHTVVAFALEGILQLTRLLARRLPSLPRRVGLSLRWAAIILLLATCAAAPPIIREVVIARKHMAARDRAREDWREHSAGVFSRDRCFRTIGGVELCDAYDATTGLRLQWRGAFFGYDDAYNAEIFKQISVEGIPEWSMKPHLVGDDELIKMLDSTEMTAVVGYPADISPSVTVFDGTISRWGATYSSDGLAIAAKHEGLIGLGSTSVSAHEPANAEGFGGLRVVGFGFRPDEQSDHVVFVGRNADYPKVVFIRNGRRWIGAFHEDGWLLKSATRR